jgi:hypothetical protein
MLYMYIFIYCKIESWTIIVDKSNIPLLLKHLVRENIKLHNTENHNGNNISSGKISNSIIQVITSATTSRQGKYQTPWVWYFPWRDVVVVVIFCVMEFDISPDEMLSSLWFSVLWSLIFPLTRCCRRCDFLCYGF